MSRGSIIGIDHVQVAAPAGCEDGRRALLRRAAGLEEMPRSLPLARPHAGASWFRRPAAQELTSAYGDEFVPDPKAIRRPVSRRHASSGGSPRSRRASASSVPWRFAGAPARLVFAVDP